MHKPIPGLLLLLALFMLGGCNSDPAKKPAYSAQRQLQAYITSPAGTNIVYRYHVETGKVLPAQELGQDSLLEFLPYPANYGFIPGTLMDTVRGGDNQPLDVLVLAQHIPANTFVEIMPLAVVQTANADGATDTKLIAIPARPSQRIIKATTYQELNSKYPAVKQMLQLWLANSEGKNSTRIMGWHDEVAAEKEVQKWLR